MNDKKPFQGSLLGAVGLFPVLAAGCALITGIDAPLVRSSDGGVPDVTTSDASDGGSKVSSSGGGDSGACKVGWANTVFPALQNDGQCGSSTACHASGGNQPAFLNGNSTGTYKSLAQYTLLENKPYIKAGDPDPAHSTIECNLVSQACYTVQQMPVSPPADWVQYDADLIDTWVRCGMPNN